MSIKEVLLGSEHAAVIDTDHPMANDPRQVVVREEVEEALVAGMAVMTTTQIAALTATDIMPLSIAGDIKGVQISEMPEFLTEVIPALTATAISTLSTSDFAVLSVGGSLGLAPLTATQIAALQ